MKTFNLIQQKSCWIKQMHYKNNALAILVGNRKNGIFAHLSINLPSSEFLDNDQFFIEKTEEHMIIVRKLVVMGLIEVVQEVPYKGFGAFALYKKLPKMEEYTKEERK